MLGTASVSMSVVTEQWVILLSNDTLSDSVTVDKQVRQSSLSKSRATTSDCKA